MGARFEGLRWRSLGGRSSKRPGKRPSRTIDYRLATGSQSVAGVMG